MELIETHCHLTMADAADLGELFRRATECSITRMICIGASDGIQSAHDAVALAEQYEQVWATVGIHPHDAGDFPHLPDLEALAAHPKVVAIGETGLDYFRDWAPFDLQRQLFRETIAFARKIKKPLVIHCREAAEDTLKILQEGQAAEVGGVFHCYAQDAAFAEKLREINFRVSFTGNITFKKATAIREVVRDIPLEQMMVETDMPFMAPEPYRGKPSEPCHVYQVAETIASVKGISIEQVAEVTTKNAIELFSLQ